MDIDDYKCLMGRWHFVELNVPISYILFMSLYTVKPVHSKRTPKLVFNTDYRLMQVKSIAEYMIIMSPELFAWRYMGKRCNQTDHFAFTFVREEKRFL